MEKPANAHGRFLDLLRQIQVVRPSRRRFATFGDSHIDYHLVTSVSLDPLRSCVRMGRVTVVRPKILTPETFLRRFRDFGPEGDAYERFLKDEFQDAFRGLEYIFKNDIQSTTPHRRDARGLADSIKIDLDNKNAERSVVVRGPEGAWSFALMKFLLEETSQSFLANVRELEERGFFNPLQTAEEMRRREIEVLFRRARADADAVRLLAEKLKEYKYFDEYQDRFFALVKPGS